MTDTGFAVHKSDAGDSSYDDACVPLCFVLVQETASVFMETWCSPSASSTASISSSVFAYEKEHGRTYHAVSWTPIVSGIAAYWLPYSTKLAVCLPWTLIPVWGWYVKEYVLPNDEEEQDRFTQLPVVCHHAQLKIVEWIFNIMQFDYSSTINPSSRLWVTNLSVS